MSEQEAPLPAPSLTPEMIALGRAFLITLVHSVRTAVHMPEVESLEEAAVSLHAAAEALYNATGGFSLKLTEGSAIINGTKIAFDGGSYGRVLREKLVARGLTSIGMKRPPSVAAIRKLISIFVDDASHAAALSGVTTQELAPVSVRAQAPAPAVVEEAPREEDRSSRAIDAFARVVLAIREQRAFVEDARQNVTATMPTFRHHLGRTLSTFVDLAEDNGGVVVSLAMRSRAIECAEARSVGVALLSIAVGHALSLGQSDLLDMALAACLADIGHADAIAEEAPLEDDEIGEPRAGSIARIFGCDAGSPSVQTIAAIVARQPHLLTLIVAAAEAYLGSDPELASCDARIAAVLRAVLDPESIGSIGSNDSVDPQPKAEPQSSPQSELQPRSGSRETVHSTGRIRLPWLEKKATQDE